MTVWIHTWSAPKKWLQAYLHPNGGKATQDMLVVAAKARLCPEEAGESGPPDANEEDMFFNIS